MIEYRKFIQDVKALDFISSQEEADAAVKTVLGILANSIDEENARKLTDNLPEPLTFEKLRRRGDSEAPSLEQYIGELEDQFKLDYDQARELLDTVFHTTKEVVGDNLISDVEDDLPSDIAEELDMA